MNKEEITKLIHETLEQQSKAGEALDTEKLLLAGNRLSTLRFNLSDLWVEARYDYQIAQSDYNAKLDQELLNYREFHGGTIEECKAFAKKETNKDLMVLIKKEKEMNQLKALREDVAIKISNIQSFSSELRSQRGMGGLQ